MYPEQQAVLGEGDGRESSPPGHARTSSSSALRTQVLALGPDQTKPCTALHTTAPLRLRLRLGGYRSQTGAWLDDASGEMILDRAALIEAGGALGTVRLSVELKGMPGVQPLTLLVGARVGEAGDVHLAFASQHIFQNHTSLNLQLHRHAPCPMRCGSRPVRGEGAVTRRGLALLNERRCGQGADLRLPTAAPALERAVTPAHGQWLDAPELGHQQHTAEER